MKVFFTNLYLSNVVYLFFGEVILAFGLFVAALLPIIDLSKESILILILTVLATLHGSLQFIERFLPFEIAIDYMYDRHPVKEGYFYIDADVYRKTINELSDSTSTQPSTKQSTEDISEEFSSLPQHTFKHINRLYAIYLDSNGTQRKLNCTNISTLGIQFNFNFLSKATGIQYLLIEDATLKNNEFNEKIELGTL